MTRRGSVLTHLGALSFSVISVSVIGCQEDSALAVAGLSDDFSLTLTLQSSDCELEGWSPHSPEPSTLSVTQESATSPIELSFEGDSEPVRASLCVDEQGAPQALCLYGASLSVYRPSLDIEEGGRCEAWRELTSAERSPEACCASASAGEPNTLRVGEGGQLSGALSVMLTLSAQAPESPTDPLEDLESYLESREALCRAPLSCHVSLSVSAFPR